MPKSWTGHTAVHAMRVQVAKNSYGTLQEGSDEPIKAVE